MNFSPDLIQASYAACQRRARRSKSNFYPCFMLLGKSKRRAMEALYAFMRHTDDLGDHPGPEQLRHDALIRWRALLDQALLGQMQPPELPEPQHGQLEHPDDTAGRILLPALADTVRRFEIPSRHLHAVIDGVEMDFRKNRYETFDELADYCRHVASAVGLACIHIWGFQGDEALQPADKCGIAMQLTNILRDLGEDVRMDRVYLPLEDLRLCDYSVEDLSAGVVDERFAHLLELQVARAEQFYHEGSELIEYLEPAGRRVFGMMMNTYHDLLGRVARHGDELLSCRLRLGRWHKLRIASRWILLPPRRAALP